MDADRVADANKQLSYSVLRSLASLSINTTRWLAPTSAACVAYGIDSPQRIAMFVAQCAIESSNFIGLRESLAYSATRLLAVFPTHFTVSEAFEFQYDSVRIAERVYGGRNGNGPEGMGDGYRYIGRGLIQITGKANYALAAHELCLDLVNHPELLEQDNYAALSAAWFWSKNDCNTFADRGDIRGCTLRINGGLNGLTDRQAAWNKTLEAVA